VSLYLLDTGNPDVEKPWQKAEKEKLEPTLSQQRNATQETLLERHPELRDFYTESDEFSVTPWDYAQYEQLKQSLTDREKALLNADKNFYAVTFRNVGGLVTPLPLRITYADGKVEELQIPAEIWRRNAEQVTKLFITEKEITGIEFDPYRATADADTGNNAWPRKPKTSRFKLYKEAEQPNPMRRDDKEKWEQPIR
jgi:hypothetical protein